MEGVCPVRDAGYTSQLCHLLLLRMVSNVGHKKCICTLFRIFSPNIPIINTIPCFIRMTKLTNVVPKSHVDNLPLCRICYEPGSLLSVCDCKGTAKYVHAECLYRWISSSGRKSCEICRAEYRLTSEQRRLCERVETTDQRRLPLCERIDMLEVLLCIGSVTVLVLLAFFIGFEISRHAI